MQAKLVRCESQIAMRRENLKRIVARIQLLEQLIVAPQYAVEILSEVYRRKNFSTKFLQVSLSNDVNKKNELMPLGPFI